MNKARGPQIFRAVQNIRQCTGPAGECHSLENMWKFPIPKASHSTSNFIQFKFNERDSIHFKFWKKALGGSSALREKEKNIYVKNLFSSIHLFPLSSLEKDQKQRNDILPLYTALHCFLRVEMVFRQLHTCSFSYSWESLISRLCCRGLWTTLHVFVKLQQTHL